MKIRSNTKSMALVFGQFVISKVDELN